MKLVKLRVVPSDEPEAAKQITLLLENKKGDAFTVTITPAPGPGDVAHFFQDVGRELDREPEEDDAYIEWVTTRYRAAEKFLSHQIEREKNAHGFTSRYLRLTRILKGATP